MDRMENCRNFLAEGKCDPWIISKFKNDEFIGSHEVDVIFQPDRDIAEEICSGCRQFKITERTFVAKEV